MNGKAVSYIEAIKKKPGILFHVALFAVMCILNYAVYKSLEKVFPDGAELGTYAIIGRSLCILIVIAMIVRASNETMKRALILMVVAVALEAGEFGCHWLYARELSTSRMAQAEIDRQKVLDDSLADKNAQRSAIVLDKLTQYNQSQSRLTQSDREYYRSTGVKRNRKVGDVPSFEQLGVVTGSQPTPMPTQAPVLANALNLGNPPPIVAENLAPLSEVQVLAKWTPRFVIAAILCLACVFVGTALVLASWEWDLNANGIPDKLEGKA